MRLEVERARLLFCEGLKLCDWVGFPLAMDVELFGRCGLEILRRIELAGYDVFQHRPTLSKWDGLKILTRCWWAGQLRKMNKPVPAL